MQSQKLQYFILMIALTALVFSLLLNGQQGLKGDTGNQGIQGIQGIQGVAGTNGTNGISSADYIVQKVGSTYQASSGINGSVIYQSNNLVEGVLQPLQDSMTGGGTIYIKDYFPNSVECQWNITQNGLTIFGSGGYHGINGLQSKTTIDTNQYMIDIGYGVEVTMIYNLGLDANYSSRILHDDGSETILRDLQIAYSYKYGVYYTGTGARYTNTVTDYNTIDALGMGIVTAGSNGIFTGCISVDNEYAGFYISGHNNTFISCQDKFDSLGFYMENTATNNHFRNCINGTAILNGQEYYAVTWNIYGATWFNILNMNTGSWLGWTTTSGLGNVTSCYITEDNKLFLACESGGASYYSIWNCNDGSQVKGWTIVP